MRGRDASQPVLGLRGRDVEAGVVPAPRPRSARRNCSASVVFPVPGPPSTRQTCPASRPPRRMPSSPRRPSRSRPSRCRFSPFDHRCGAPSGRRRRSSAGPAGSRGGCLMVDADRHRRSRRNARTRFDGRDAACAARPSCQGRRRREVRALPTHPREREIRSHTGADRPSETPPGRDPVEQAVPTGGPPPRAAPRAVAAPGCRDRRRRGAADRRPRRAGRPARGPGPVGSRRGLGGRARPRSAGPKAPDAGSA